MLLLDFSARVTAPKKKLPGAQVHFQTGLKIVGVGPRRKRIRVVLMDAPNAAETTHSSFIHPLWSSRRDRRFRKLDLKNVI